MDASEAKPKKIDRLLYKNAFAEALRACDHSPPFKPLFFPLPWLLQIPRPVRERASAPGARG